MDEKELSQNKLNRICRGILVIYFLAMAVIYPFYAPGGYTRLAEVKYEFFRNASLLMIAMAAVVLLLSVIAQRDQRGKIINKCRQMSVTDWFGCGYFVMVIVSWLCSDYKKDALLGFEGLYMGVITQLILILIYFLFSRYFCCDLKWIGVWLAAAAGAFLLGICNRYSIYPIVMEGAKPTFISTLGNINWFCGYWSVTAPIGILLYWYSDEIRVRTAAGIYSVIAMLLGITQGSESAYIVFAVVFLALFLLSFDNYTRMCHFLELCMMFACSCHLAKMMMYMPGLHLNYITNVGSVSFGFTETLILGNTGIWMFFIVFGFYILLRIAKRRGFLKLEDYWKKHHRLKGVVTAAIIISICIAAVFVLIRSGGLGAFAASGATKDAGYIMFFNNDWGTDRGFAWNCGINAWLDMDILHKLVGIGPDCFFDYIYGMPKLAGALADKFGGHILASAYNEQITLLVNTGILGWLCYAGIFLTAFVRYIRKADLQPLLYACAVSILVYSLHNMVSFQQVLNTPYVFIVLGMGESLYRTARQKNHCE